MEITKFYTRKNNNLEELDINKLCSRDYFFYYNIFIAIKLEFIKVKQVLPRYIVFDETLMPNNLIVYVYRNELKPEDLINYSFNYVCIKEGLENQTNANSNDEFTIKFYIL